MKPDFSELFETTVRMQGDTHGTADSPAIVAVGGELHARVCLLADGEARLSANFGDLKEPSALRDMRRLVGHACRLGGDRAPIIAHDLHPHYHSTHAARATGRRTAAVQHHHAHIASVLAEHGTSGPVIGVACDGSGYGEDGAVWGCEILWCDGAKASRLGHLAYFPLLGGDAAASQTWRPAAALLRLAFGDGWHEAWPHGADLPNVALVNRMFDARLNAPMTSSLGRVFDGIAFLLGTCPASDPRLQAAASLEQAAARCGSEWPYQAEIVESHGVLQLRIEPMIREIVAARREGEAIERIAARFHETIAWLLADAVRRAGERTGISTVALSGGCFVNDRLRGRLSQRLAANNLRVLTNRIVSCGDAGLSLGQAHVALWRETAASDRAAVRYRSERMSRVPSCSGIGG